MGDILTQVQDELDKLLNQMRISLTYIKERGPPAPISNQPLLSSFAEHEAQAASQGAASQEVSQAPSQPSQIPAAPLPKSEFQDGIRELSRDLVLKEQQIEVLIASLPGLNTSEKEQVERMKELERQLEDIEHERLEAVKERKELLRKVEEKIGSVGSMR